MTPFKETRKNFILKKLDKHREVLVNELASELNVSTVTIRSDLQQMESEGTLTRTHGGAILGPNNVGMFKSATGRFSALPIAHDYKKERIGQVVSNLVQAEDWIFLGSGTTAYYAAHALVERSPLNVLTNNLYVALELANNPLSNVIMTGGTLSHSTYNLGGEIFERSLQPISISKAFISPVGMDMSTGYTVSTPGELNVFKVIRKISKELYIIADTDKFDHTGFIRIGELDEADYFITDAMPPSNYLDYFTSRGIPVLTPESISANPL